MRIVFFAIISLVSSVGVWADSNNPPVITSGIHSSTGESLDGLAKIGAANPRFVWTSGESAQPGKLVQLESMETPRANMFRASGVATEEVELSSPLLEGVTNRLTLPRIRQSEHLRYTDYRSAESTISVIPESGNRFGMTTIDSTPHLTSGFQSGFTTGYGFHFLSGPTSIDLPARLYTFGLGYQHRGRLNEFSSYDLGANVTVNSDFEGSAREGVLFPGHAVGMLHMTPETDWVFGIDYLHRDDIKLLPVVGFSRHSHAFPNVRLDCVFPRPKIQMVLPSGRIFHVAGRLGGGTWDMELPSGAGDVVTYRDYRLLLGFSRRNTDSGNYCFEVGYLFGRKIGMRESLDTLRPSDAVILQLVTIR
jgi:hypothetical protein